MAYRFPSYTFPSGKKQNIKKKKKLKCLDFRGQTRALHTSSEFAVLDDALIWNMLKDSSMKENSIEIRIR